MGTINLAKKVCADEMTRGTHSFSLNMRLTTAGSAWPRLAFITWPTRKPITCCLPPLILLDLFGIRGDHFVDDLAERAFVADRTPGLRAA